MSAPTQSHHTESLETCIRHRHSIRFYKPDSVPDETLHYCLSLAQLAPSNSNMQNWRLYLASDAARARIVAALSHESTLRGPVIPPLPEQFKHFRSEFGHQLYGEQGYGIPREARGEHKAAVLRNFEFFGAPTVGVICMHRDLTMADSMSVGMFVQTLMLALTEQGLGCCLQVSVTGFPEVLRREFGIAEEEMILCGIAIGFPAEHSKVNELVVPRERVEEQVSMLVE